MVNYGEIHGMNTNDLWMYAPRKWINTIHGYLSHRGSVGSFV